MGAEISSNFSTEAWYKSGGTVFSTLHGKLTATDSGLNFIDEDGTQILSLLFAEIHKVRLDPSEFLFKTASGDYLVSLFNLKKYSAQMGAGGVVGMGLGMRYVNVANGDAIKLENIIKSHGIATYGLKTNVNYAQQQRRGVALLFLYIVMIGGAIYVLIALFSHH